jgi:alpha/beta superfamily hydrolase
MGIRARVLTLPAHSDPTTAARTAKHMTAVVFHPRSQPEKETTMAEANLTTRMREAIPDLPPALSADRTSCQSKGHGDRNDWRAIPGWSKYQVSSNGQVRRVGQSKGAVTGRVLRQLLNKKTGYLSVCLCERPRTKRMDIHRIVALAFHGPAPSSGHVVAHNDGNRTNNTAENLRWATQAENLGDCRVHGTAMIGSKNPSSSISEIDVRAIRRMKTFGIPRTIIAEGYGMHQRSIFRILSNTSWGHVL